MNSAHPDLTAHPDFTAHPDLTSRAKLKRVTLLIFIVILAGNLPAALPFSAPNNRKPRPKKIRIDVSGGISSAPPTAGVAWSDAAGGDQRKASNTKQPKKSRQSAKKDKISSQRTAAPGDGKKLTIKTAKRGSKTVTVLTPLAAMPMEPKKMLKRLKERLGTGGTVAGDAVEVQGDHQKAINDFVLSIDRGGFASGDAVEVQGDHQKAINDFVLSIDRGGFAFQPPTAQPTTAPTETAVSFPAYLELTDAYGVVFNANYLLLYARLLPSPRLRKVRDMKFRRSARLGDVMDVVVAEETDGAWECKAEVCGESCNSATVWLANDNGDDEVQIEGLLSHDDGSVRRSKATVYHDELTEGSRLSAVSLLRWCERARTDMIGGPEAISRGLEEGVAVVVAKTSLDLDPRRSLEPGERLEVRTRAKVRGGRVAEFRHEVWHVDTGVAMASADVTCVAMATKTGQSSRFLDWMTSGF